MADVFISYARANARAAQRVADGLLQQGYSVWFDDQLPAHRAYSEVIEEELNRASAVLVLWSDEAVSSHWVRSEANRGRERGRLVQARFGGTRLPLPFDQIQCVDLDPDALEGDSSGWRRVRDALAELTGGKADATEGEGRVTSPHRRQWLKGAGALGLAAVGAGGAWWWTRQPALSPEAQLLFQKGLDALQINDALDPDDPGATLQAIALLTQATAAAPDFADGWGALAMAYAVRRGDIGVPDRDGMESRARSAAARALALDDKQPTALGALLLLIPVYRNWTEAERSARAALKKDQRYPLLLFILSSIMASVGRWQAAVEAAKPFDRTRWRIPGADRRLLLGHWSVGEMQQADAMQRHMAETWPQHPQVWKTRLAFLMYSGRPGKARELLGDLAERPPSIGEDFVQVTEATCQALEPTGSRRVGISANLAHLRRDPRAALATVHACAALGGSDEAFAILRGYYLGTGEWSGVAPQGGDRDKRTAALFQPPARNLWDDQRFASLIAEIGLEDYWRKTGTRPDFRLRG